MLNSTLGPSRNSPARSIRSRPSLIEEKGFAGAYISGAVLANDPGPDIGLTTLTEVAARAGQITPHDGLAYFGGR